MDCISAGGESTAILMRRFILIGVLFTITAFPGFVAAQQATLTDDAYTSARSGKNGPNVKGLVASHRCSSERDKRNCSLQNSTGQSLRR